MKLNFYSRIKKSQFIIKHGPIFFILFYGALVWGLSSGLLWSFLMWYFMPNINLYIYIPIALVIFPLSGMIWGAHVWRSINR
jgi:hypothetical protein